MFTVQLNILSPNSHTTYFGNDDSGTHDPLLALEENEDGIGIGIGIINSGGDYCCIANFGNYENRTLAAVPIEYMK